MLIAFEGQDGAGKTSLLHSTHARMVTIGMECLIVEEFSASHHGKRLLDALARDKFLRPTPGDGSTALTRALEVAADLYYLDHFVIGPAILQGRVVLKDRHRDTNIYAAAPMIVTSGAVPTEAAAVAWLATVNAHLAHPADLTVYVDASLERRIERITRRTRALVEDRARDVSDDDIATFEHRDRIAKQLVAQDPNRYLVVNNDDADLNALAADIVMEVRKRLRAAVGRSVTGD